MCRKNIIPICAIADANFSFAIPALFISILENSSDENFFEFHCFVDSTVPESYRQKILLTQNNYENCSINLIDMKDTYKDCINRHPTITNVCLYKFAIIDKLKQYDKVLYLDADMVINGDLSELYNIDLKNNYVGAVFNIFYYIYKKELASMLKIPDLESYFNAGVMLMNTKKMREDNLVKELEKYIGQFEGSVDQHIFNKVCYGKILNIPPKYNATIKYQELYKLPEAEAFYTKKEISEAIDNPVILHYTGELKPWKYSNLQLSWKWFKYFLKSDFKDYPLKRLPFNVKLNKMPLNVLIKGKVLSLGAKLSNLLNIKVDYYEFLSVLQIIKQKKVSPLCFIIKSAKNNTENNNLLQLLVELKKCGRVVFVISKSGGSAEKKFREAADYFFKINNIDFYLTRPLRTFQFIVLSEADIYKVANVLSVNNVSFLWLIQNRDKKNKIEKQSAVASELIRNSKNVITEFDMNKLIEILSK